MIDYWSAMPLDTDITFAKDFAHGYHAVSLTELLFSDRKRPILAMTSCLAVKVGSSEDNNNSDKL